MQFCEILCLNLFFYFIKQVIENFCNSSLLYRYGLEIEETPLELLWSFVVSIFLIGGGLGALFGGPIANGIGR